jgi:coenzyme F420-dependent glucose-6-phosphate dehydrogenase
MLKLGYKASGEQFGPSELLDFSCLAEEIGVDSVFISDHFQPWRHTGGDAPSCIPWLGALGARTERIIIGTSVMTPTFRYHPSVVAQAFATLAVMFPNRVVLDLGSGESLNDVPALGLMWPTFKERIARLLESITVMRRLWTQDRVTFEGQYYRTDKATLYDKPSTPVPIYLAVSGPTVTKMAGELAEGYLCTSGKALELYKETLLPDVEAGLEAAGRKEDSIDRMIEMKVSFDSDLQRARDGTKHWAALALSPEEKMSVEDPVVMEWLADSLPLEYTEKRWIVSNNPDEHVARITPYINLGFRHLVFHAPGPDQKRFLRLYGEQVIPRLRRL